MEGLQEVIIYSVKISIKRKYNNFTEDETRTILYYVGKKNDDSPWLIYDERQSDRRRQGDGSIVFVENELS